MADVGYIQRLPLDVIAQSHSAGPAHMLPTGFATTIADILHQLHQSLQHSQVQPQHKANKKHQPHTFQTGDKVLINMKNLPLSYGNAYAGSSSKNILVSSSWASKEVQMLLRSLTYQRIPEYRRPLMLTDYAYPI